VCRGVALYLRVEGIEKRLPQRDGLCGTADRPIDGRQFISERQIVWSLIAVLHC